MNTPSIEETSAQWLAAKRALADHEAESQRIAGERTAKRNVLMQAIVTAHSKMESAIRRLEELDAVAFAKNCSEDVSSFTLSSGGQCLDTSNGTAPTRHVCAARFEREGKRRGEMLAKAEAIAREQFDAEILTWNGKAERNMGGGWTNRNPVPVLKIPTWSQLVNA